MEAEKFVMEGLNAIPVVTKGQPQPKPSTRRNFGPLHELCQQLHSTMRRCKGILNHVNTFGPAGLIKKLERRIGEGDTVRQEVTSDGIVTYGQDKEKQEDLQPQVKELKKQLMEIKKKHTHLQK